MLCGTFRVDFVARIGHKNVGLECDGKDYHNFSRAEWLVAMRVGSEALDAVPIFLGKG